MTFIVVTGRETALRFVPPRMGSLRLGAGLECELRVEERGVEDLHCELFCDAAPSVRPLGGAVSVVSAEGDRERSVASGTTAAVAPGERIRVGPVDVEWVHSPDSQDAAPRLYDITTLDARLAEGGPGVLLRLTGAFDRAAEARLGAKDFAVRLDEAAVAVWLDDGQAHDAHTFAAGLALELEGATTVGQEAVTAEAALAQLTPATQVPRLRVPPRAPAMVALERQLDQAAQGDAPVLVLGETGTGKDLLVETLHARSSRAGRPLIRVSAVEIDEEGLNPALVERALGGTLVIDEISALGARAQVSLTRTLEKPSPLRFVATSNHDLDAWVREGSFPKDLFFRFSGIRIDVPPLRERKEDIVPLAEAFARRAGVEGSLSLALAHALENHRWPGNVRELESVIRQAAIASGGADLSVDHLPREFRAGPSPMAAAASSETLDPDESSVLSLRDEIAALERRRILEALEKQPTQTEAAKALGIPLRTFLNRMDALGIPRARKK